MVIGLHGNTYDEKLKEVGLKSLSHRRQRGDMIQVWKYIHGKSSSSQRMFQLASDKHSRRTRHTAKPFNIAKPKCHREVRQNFFTVRCVDAWNQLPTEVQGMDDMVKFEITYDELFN